MFSEAGLISGSDSAVDSSVGSNVKGLWKCLRSLICVIKNLSES